MVHKIKKAAFKKRAFFSSSINSKGSMALEGSLVLPIFLFFMMTVLLSLEAVRFSSDVQEAVYQAGNKYALAGYQMKYGNEVPPGIHGQIKEYLDCQLYPYLCVAEGEKGVRIQDLSSVMEDGRIEFTAEYRLKPFIGWLPIGTITIRDRFFSHAWTGYTGTKMQGAGQQETYVYVTRTGTKYHLSYDCSYLKVQVQAVKYEEIPSMRNPTGEKYHACLRCKPGKDSVVYITTDGNRYHGSADCSALKRVVYMISLQEAEGYGACSKCAG